MKKSSIVTILSAAVIAAAGCIAFGQAAPGGAPAGGGAAAPGGGFGGGGGGFGGGGFGGGGGPGGGGGFGGGAPGGGGFGGGGGAFGGGGAGGRGGRGGGRGGFGGFGGGQTFTVGDPAPIPSAVVMPGHADANQLEAINADLKKFIDSDSSPAKPFIDKYIKLTPPNVAASFTDTAQRNPRHAAFVDQAKAGGADVLFIGDSITDWWKMNGGEAYTKYFGDMKVDNFAVAGDTTQGVLWGLKNGEGRNTDGTPVAIKPKAIMVMIGTNNTGPNSGPEIAEGVGAVVLELRHDFPDAKILLLAIFPRGTGPTDMNRVKNDAANKIIAKLDDKQHVFFMDLGPKFLDDKGVLLPGTFMTTDNLHPTNAGYEIWGAAVKDTIASWMK